MLDAIYRVLLELSPWFLLGMLVSGLLHVLLPRDFIERRLTGPWGVARAVSLGVPLPLCSCGVIPAGLGLKRDGASNGAALGFLISTPQTGVDSILVSASFLGWPFALFKVLAAAVTGIVGGLFAEVLPDSDDTERDLGNASSRTGGRGLRAMFEHAHDLLASIWRWIVFGIVVSALIDTYLPVGTLGVFADLGPFGAGFAVLLISLPLYVCATASVPIAASMVANGMPIGAALVFLMAGPASNVATIGAIYRGFGGRQLALYLCVLVVGSIGFGVLFDSVISAESVTQNVPLHDRETWWAVGSAALLAALIARLAARDLLRFVREHATAAETGEQFEVGVEGMSCGNCVRKVEGALRSLDGVTSAVVMRNPDRAIVRGQVDRTRIDAAIVDAGYRVRPA